MSSSISTYFKDRSVEYPGRFKATNIDTLEETTLDLVRDEGTISEAGTPFSADKFNRIADEMLDIGEKNALIIANMLGSTSDLTGYFNKRTGFSWGVKYGKIGDLLIAMVNAQVASAIPANTTKKICTNLPTGFRPGALTYGIIRQPWGAGSDVDYTEPYLTLSSTGVFNLMSGDDAIPAGTVITGEVTYWT